MTEIDIAEGELRDGRPTPEHLQQATDALWRDGFVVLNDVVNLDHIAVLRDKMLEDVEAILARPDAPYNFNTGNIQQEPPPLAPFLFRDVLVNDIVVAVTKAVLGPGLKNNFYSGNTTVPGDPARQPVHPDVAQLWPNLAHPTPAFGLVVNVPVVDMTPENGSTEFWPGTHHDTTYSVHDGSLRIPEEVLRQKRAVYGDPFQPRVRAGSIVIRDIRMWHAGMPNRTTQPRPMIAMIHWCSWWSDGGPLDFPKGTEPVFEHPDLRTVARFVDGPIDYIHHSEAYDFQK